MSGWRDAWFRVSRMGRKELRQLFRDPKTRRVIFASPILQLVLFGYAVNTDVRQVSTFVVDHDRTAESRQLVEGLTSAGYFRVTGTSMDPADLTFALDRGDALVGVWIPVGFARDVTAGRSPAVQVLLDGANSNTATVSLGYVQRIVQDLAQEQLRAGPGGPAGGAAEALRSGGVDLRTRAWFNPSLSSRMYNVPAVIGVIVFLMCLLLTAMGVVRERELGTLEQLLVSPLTAGELMLGKTLPVAGVALMQVALTTSVAVFWFDTPLRGSLATLLVGAVLFILAGLALGLLISTVSATQQEAFLAMYLLLLPAIILSGFLYPVETMPPFFQWLTLANPLRHFLEVVRAIFLKGSGFAELWRQYLTLAGMAVTVLWFATVRFRGSLQ